MNRVRADEEVFARRLRRAATLIDATSEGWPSSRTARPRARTTPAEVILLYATQTFPATSGHLRRRTIAAAGVAVSVLTLFSAGQGRVAAAPTTSQLVTNETPAMTTTPSTVAPTSHTLRALSNSIVVARHRPAQVAGPPQGTVPRS